jgi:hypothetical protein
MIRINKGIISICVCLILFSSMVISCAQEPKVGNFYEQPAEIFIDLRNRVLKASPEDFGIEVSSAIEPWAILMDMGLSEGVVTLVCLKDGSTSLYFSNGGGIIGGGEHKNVNNAAKNFVKFSKDFIPLMEKVTTYPLLILSKVRFYIITKSGIFSSKLFDESELGDNNKFSKLYNAGHGVIAALRENEENDPPTTIK